LLSRPTIALEGLLRLPREIVRILIPEPVTSIVDKQPIMAFEGLWLLTTSLEAPDNNARKTTAGHAVSVLSWTTTMAQDLLENMLESLNL
jgi:hypothetical protein